MTQTSIISGGIRTSQPAASCHPNRSKGSCLYARCPVNERAPVHDLFSPAIHDFHLDLERTDDPWASHHETNTFWQKQTCDQLLQPNRCHEPQAQLIVCPDFNTLSRWHLVEMQITSHCPFPNRRKLAFWRNRGLWLSLLLRHWTAEVSAIKDYTHVVTIIAHPATSE